jgi:hypothetical protein
LQGTVEHVGVAFSVEKVADGGVVLKGLLGDFELWIHSNLNIV